jgi:hypothetical protein
MDGDCSTYAGNEKYTLLARNPEEGENLAELDVKVS